MRLEAFICIQNIKIDIQTIQNSYFFDSEFLNVSLYT